jgi:hypothetical protein
MSKYEEIFDYLKQCPQLYQLWGLYAEEIDGTSVILPFGTSRRTTLTDYTDTIGGYNGEIEPLTSVYEEYQVNCYKDITPNATEYNFMKLEDVQAVCDWIIEQDENGNLPKITGKQIISVEPFPFIPQVRYIDPDKNIIAYFITVRITYVNPALARTVEF